MKQKLTKITAFLLIAMLLFCALPIVAGAASASTESALRTNVNKGGTVKLTKDIKLSERLVVPKGITVTLDLNGKKLYRDLTECKEDGNVIFVDEGASLILTDTLKAHGGTITGGVAPKGGGIFNRGSLTVTNGVRIAGNYANKAFANGVPGARNRNDEGGGIYNDKDASLTLQGGEITDNEAYFGGGVSSAIYTKITIEPGSYNEVVDGVKKTLESGVTITKNRGTYGAGISSEVDLALSGAAELSGNENGDDLRVGKGLRIVCGALTYKTPFGVSFFEFYAPNTEVITTGWGANNTGRPDQYFFCPDRSVKMNATAAQNGEIKLNLDMKKTVVEVFEKGILTKTEEFDSPADALRKAASYATPCWYSFNDPQMREFSETFSLADLEPSDSLTERLLPAKQEAKAKIKGYEMYTQYFDDWYKAILNRGQTIDIYGDIAGRYSVLKGMTDAQKYAASGYGHWDGSLQDDCQVKVTFGANLKFSKPFKVGRSRNIVIDLNGHNINRGGKSQTNGNLFTLDVFSKLTVMDSNPNADGYKGLKGGVLTGGAGSECSGGFILKEFSELNIAGGTVYNCVTDLHGGAIYSNSPNAKVILKDCTFDSCKTENSRDDCNGGAIYTGNSLRITMENVTFRNCYSEDYGGAVYLGNCPGYVQLKNVTFDGNEAKDNGGAMQIGNINDGKMFLLEAAHCTFINNKAGVDGGAVCVKDNDDSAQHKPMVFRSCTFTGNSARDGSAFELDDNSVALLSCTITGNKASRSGAVYVNDARSVSVGGTTVIKNNTGKDLLLDKDGNKTRVYPVGLITGAEIVVSSDSTDKSTVVMKDIDQRQVQYFRSESGTRLEFSKTGEREARMVVASLFGNRSVWLVILIAAVAVVSATIIVIKKKKDGRKTEHDA